MIALGHKNGKRLPFLFDIPWGLSPWGMWLLDYTFKYVVVLNATVNLWNIIQHTKYNREQTLLQKKKILYSAAITAANADNIRTQCVYFNGFCCISFRIVNGDTQLRDKLLHWIRTRFYFFFALSSCRLFFIWEVTIRLIQNSKVDQLIQRRKFLLPSSSTTFSFWDYGMSYEMVAIARGKPIDI